MLPCNLIRHSGRGLAILAFDQELHSIVLNIDFNSVGSYFKSTRAAEVVYLLAHFSHSSVVVSVSHSAGLSDPFDLALRRDLFYDGGLIELFGLDFSDRRDARDGQANQDNNRICSLYLLHASNTLGTFGKLCRTADEELFRSSFFDLKVSIGAT